MAMTVEQIAAEAMSLPNEDRALLADKLVEGLDPIPGGRIDAIWADEARRRLDDVRSGQVRTISGEEVAERVRKAAGL